MADIGIRLGAARAGRRWLRAVGLAATLMLLPLGVSAQEPGGPVIGSDWSTVSPEVLSETPEPQGWVAEGGALGLLPSGPAEAPAAPATADAAAATAVPSALTPVVVELFTAQGCSSCPPADALLAGLAARSDVLPLAFHVDYWDYLGWTDAFARPEFTDRQRDYAAGTGERAVWTPQMIVGGTDTLIDLTPAALDQLIEAQRERRAPVAVTMTRHPGGATLQVTPVEGGPRPIAVDLIRYLPQRTTEIRTGENRGRLAESHNIVVSIESLAQWDGRNPLRLAVTLGAGGQEALPADTRHAILIQERPEGLPGAVLAALPLD